MDGLLSQQGHLWLLSGAELPYALSGVYTEWPLWMLCMAICTRNLCMAKWQTASQLQLNLFCDL